jgi:hypothetical protein
VTEAVARAHCRWRDRGRCRVPGCAAHANHLHHIVFRSQSSELLWEPSNLLSVCAGHHALIHARTLTVTGDAEIDDGIEVTGDDFDLVAQSCGGELVMDKDSVYCACGSQWHGAWVEKSSAIIASHMGRWQSHQGGCGDISHAQYAAKFRCTCDLCATERLVRRRLKRENRTGVPIVRSR